MIIMSWTVRRMEDSPAHKRMCFYNKRITILKFRGSVYSQVFLKEECS